jgi:ligand-binding SRPBCC domain-containing protein
VEFSKSAGLYKLYNEQVLNVSLNEAWEFFSNPANLETITPSDMHFKILSLDGDKAYSGQVITYSIRLNALLKMKWVTEIKHVQKPHCFVDEQRFGPYKFWHHAHLFEELPSGKVLMKDIVHFKLPFSWVAPIAYKLFVRKNLEKIFTFRTETLKSKFK